MAKVIDDIFIRSNRKDRKIKERICTGYAEEINGFTVFTLEQTRHWFENGKFKVEEGFHLIDTAGNTYLVVSMNYKEKRPKCAVIKTVKIVA